MNKVFILVFVAVFSNVKAQNEIIQLDDFDTLNPQVGQYITIRGIMPDYHWGIRDRTIFLLDSVAKFINKTPQLIFQVENYTDCRASTEYNRDLSQRRADIVRSELLRRLKDTLQLSVAVGMGEDSLLIKKCQCDMSDYQHICTEAEHQLNRRTLLRVIGRKED